MEVGWEQWGSEGERGRNGQGRGGETGKGGEMEKEVDSLVLLAPHPHHQVRFKVNRKLFRKFSQLC